MVAFIHLCLCVSGRVYVWANMHMWVCKCMWKTLMYVECAYICIYLSERMDLYASACVMSDKVNYEASV